MCHVCLLVGYGVDAAAMATEGCTTFSKKANKGCHTSVTVTDKIYASNASCFFVEFLGTKHFSPL